MKSSPSIWRYVVSVKSMVKILLIFLAFFENMNFKRTPSKKHTATGTNPKINKHIPTFILRVLVWKPTDFKIVTPQAGK